MTTVANKIRKALGTEALTLDELMDQLDSSCERRAISKYLHTMKGRDEVKTGLDAGKVTYQLVATPREYGPPATAPNRTAAKKGSKPYAPGPTLPAAQAVPVAESSALPATSHPTHEATIAAIRKPCGLLDRCNAVAVDIEDLLGDACDQKLDHELIKALLVAQGAVHRAARAMVAG